MPRKKLLLTAAVVLALLSVLQLKMTLARRDGSYSLFDPLVDVCSLVQQRYVTETEDEELVAAAINGMLHKLDPYSEYVPPRDVEEFHKRTSGTYEGIGVGIDIKNNILTVISPFEDSPAYKVGVRPGDVILEVDGKTTKGWSSTRAVQELTGPAGTKVRIRLLHRDGTEEEVTITRQKIQVPTVRGWRRNTVDGKWDYMLDPEAGIGYVRVTQFTDDMIDHFDRAVGQLQKQELKALIFDLRTNPGGLMSAAIDVVDRFIDHGVIVSTRGAHSSEQVQRAKAGNTYPRFDLIVLIDQGSASASEIVAGALQSQGRAVIVGKRSWGKGSVQRIIRLPDSGAALKLTTDYYYLPNGRCVHRRDDAEEWGVDPDVEQDLDIEELEELRELSQELTIEPLAQIEGVGDDSSQDDGSADGSGGGSSDGSGEGSGVDGQAAVATVAARTAEELWELDDEARDTAAERLLELDDQLGQAVKQAHGLLRTQPSLRGLAGMFVEPSDDSESVEQADEE